MMEPAIDYPDQPFHDVEPAPYPEYDDDDPAVFVEYTNALYEERRAAQEPYRKEWVQNLLFLAGLQWWKYSTISGTFRLPKVPPWKQRPVWNMLRPFARTMMAKLLKNRPVATCVARSDDPTDIYAASLGNDILHAKWIELKMEKKLRQAVAWMIATGNAYWMGFWNTDTGKLQPNMALYEAEKLDANTGETMGTEVVNCPCDENGEAIMDQSGMYDLEADPAYYDQGEIGVKVLSPFQVFPNEDAIDEDDIDSVIIVESVPVRELRRKWPRHAASIVPEDTSEIDDHHQLMGLGTEAGADTHYAGAQFDKVDSGAGHRQALVKYLYERPTPAHAKGRMWITCGQVLLEEPQPLPDGIWLPMIHFKDNEVPGQFLGDATVTPAIGPQRELNELAGMIKEHFKLFIVGKWAVPKGSGVKRGAIGSRPGEVIHHNPGLAPTQIDLKPLPAAVNAEREKLEEVLQKITGVHDASLGKAPEGVTAGRAFMVLQEADDTDLGPVTRMLEDCVARLSWDMLRIIQQNYGEERTIRISSKNKAFQTRAFMGADLMSIVDVEPQVGSAFPWNATAKQSQVLDTIQVIPEILMDPDTGQLNRQQFREAMAIGGEELVGTAGDDDVAEALRENERFLGWDGDQLTAEMLPAPQIWQDNHIHLRQHAKVLKSAEFETEWPPWCRQALMLHYHATLIILQAEQAAQMEAEAAATGGGGEGGASGATNRPLPGMPPTRGAALHRTETRSRTPGESSAA